MSVLALTIGAAKADTIDFTGAEIYYTVPVSGLYDITAYGAQGGPAVSFGGSGAEAGGDIFLSAGTTLTVVAGGGGSSRPGTAAAGAAAASFSRAPPCSWRPAAAGAASRRGTPRRVYVAGPGLATTAGGAGKACRVRAWRPGEIGGLGERAE